MKRKTVVLLVFLILAIGNVSYADIGKDEAIDIAVDALEMHFDVHREDFIHNNLDAVFVIDTENYYGAPTDQPYWKIRFGWGQAYGVAISNEGDVIALQGPGTPYYPINSTIFDNCTPGTPNEKSASRQMVKDTALEALQLQEYDVTIDTMEVDIQLVDNEWYMWGEEPVWIVTLSSADEENWYVLMSNEGLVLDIASEGKLFDCSCFLH
ncbi:MAG: hypothetical protein PUC00_05495 [Clostridiales bacterium]|nr:hypothetical protein [Clostridiales bacterium]